MVLWLLIIAHLLADFTFQSADWAVKKTKQFRYLFGHAIIYALTVAGSAFICVPTSRALWPVSIIVFTHFVIDWIRVYVDKRIQSKIVNISSFVLDQMLHITIIFVVYHIYGLDDHFRSWVYACPADIDLEKLLRYALIFVSILDPAAVFVKKLSIYVSKDGNTPSLKKEPPVGRVIGKLERVIIAILVICNEIGAIGFVLTAKSLARYKQLNDQDFAEKYLVGTLSSTAIAIITALLLK